MGNFGGKNFGDSALDFALDDRAKLALASSAKSSALSPKFLSPKLQAFTP
jgi:hypothetical protein